MKRLICMVLAILLPIGGACASGSVLSKMDDEALLQLADEITAELRSRGSEAIEVIPTKNEAAAPKKSEGIGWATPEEAVLVYLDGLKTGDLAKMLSAFAVETYAENYDLHAQLERIKTYTVAMEIKFPNQGELLKTINVEAVKGRIIGRMIYQIMTLVYPDIELGTNILLSEYEGGADAFIAYLSGDAIFSLSSIEAGEFLDPSALHEIYLHERNQENLNRQKDVYGADELKSVVTTLTFNSRTYLLCVDALRYGERWYLCSLGGNMGDILQIPFFDSGLIPYPIRK